MLASSSFLEENHLVKLYMISFFFIISLVLSLETFMKYDLDYMDQLGKSMELIWPIN